MKKLFLLITIFAITFVNAQGKCGCSNDKLINFEVYLGPLGSNYDYAQVEQGALTDAEIAIHGGIKATARIAELFEVQGDTATLKGTASFDYYHGSESKLRNFVPSAGLRLELPLYVEYGASLPFENIRS